MKRANARSVQILKTLREELLSGRYSKTDVFPSEIALARRFDAEGNGREAEEVAARLIRRKAAGVVS